MRLFNSIGKLPVLDELDLTPSFVYSHQIMKIFSSSTPKATRIQRTMNATERECCGDKALNNVQELHMELAQKIR